MSVSFGSCSGRRAFTQTRWLLSLGICAGLAVGIPSWVEAAEKTGRLFYLGVTYDGAPPEGKDVNDFNFATENLSSLMATRGEPAFHEIDVHELKGDAATHEAFLQELGDLAGKVQSDDIVMLYFGSHGGWSRKDGWGAGLAGGGIGGGELRQALAAIPCQVIAVVSSCGSGGFARPGKKEPPMPPNLTALCACRRKKSTGSQLDVAVNEALAGFADRDHNGEVTLREVLQYIPQRYLEEMSEEQRQKEAAELMPVLVPSPSAPMDRVLTAASLDRVYVWSNDNWRGGLRVGDEDGKTRVQFLGWDRNDPTSGYGMPDALVDAEMLVPPGSFPPLRVEQNGTWYPARVLGKEGRRFRIHYLGYPASDDETVPADRVRFVQSARGTAKVPAGGNPKRKEKDDLKLTPVEREFVNAINAARQERGLPPLGVNAALVKEGREHARNMASRGEVQDSFDGQMPGDRIRGTGVMPNHWGITNGEGKTTAEVIQGWLDSPIAAANILEPSVNEMGIGVAPGPKRGHYVSVTYVQVEE